MVEGDAHRKGHFTEVVLRPQIVVSAESDVTLARQLHDTAHHECFLANSVNFPVRCEPAIHRQG
jgi:organic hydroperoxide reductase OsmC/OhrA